MRILANDGISEEGKLALEKAGYFVQTETIAQENLIAEINKQDFEILLVRSATTVRKDLIDACPNLKLIGRGGVGMDNIDVAYAQENGKVVINTPASSSQSVAELVMAHMFAISRFLNDAYKNIENGDFKTLKNKFGKGIELRGKTLGIIGFGRIGQSLASYALACGMNVIAIDHSEREIEIPLVIGNGNSLSVKIKTNTDISTVLGECDFFSLHVPKQHDGSAVFGESEFSKMKKGVRLVNASRGGVIDEKALINALDNGTVAFAALDVFENEPNPDSALLAHPKIACTPHIGAATEEAQDRIGLELADLIVKNFGVFSKVQA
jgi:D-3-phosphoglycerate dehydrogenase